MLDTTKNKKCDYIKTDGTKCNAYALSDSEYCLWHEPSLENFRQANNKNGGRNRKYINVEGVKVKIENIDSVMEIIEEVISNLREMDISVPQTRALLSAAESAIKALEYRELSDRLAKLEERLYEKSAK